MDEDAFEAQLSSSLLDNFQRLASQFGELATLQFIDEDPEPHGLAPDYDGSVGHWSLQLSDAT